MGIDEAKAMVEEAKSEQMQQETLFSRFGEE